MIVEALVRGGSIAVIGATSFVANYLTSKAYIKKAEKNAIKKIGELDPSDPDFEKNCKKIQKKETAKSICKTVLTTSAISIGGSAAGSWVYDKAPGWVETKTHPAPTTPVTTYEVDGVQVTEF